MSFPQGFYRCQSNSLNVLFLGSNQSSVIS
uniref:Uncharacterized protein n=1 Tax=Anguilla anguilla TaxID=7936 RepID=A0A0E9RPH5_ANGAN